MHDLTGQGSGMSGELESSSLTNSIHALFSTAGKLSPSDMHDLTISHFCLMGKSSTGVM